MGCKSHVPETTSLKVPVGMTGVEHRVCVSMECKATTTTSEGPSLVTTETISLVNFARRVCVES